MKVFISIPVNGRSDREVSAEKRVITDQLRAQYGADIQITDSYIPENAPVAGDMAGVWYLGESIKRLAESDTAAFAHGWKDARGCRIERAVCEAYGIPILG